MLKTELEIVKKQVEGKSVGGELISALKLSVGWGFIAALVIGGLVAGVWTLIPTNLLAWGSSKVNLIGYVSHCPFTPISSLSLFGGSLIGVALATKMRGRTPIGYTVMAATALGTLIGMMNGIDTDMFIMGGMGSGIGIFLGILVGMLKRTRG